MTTDETREFAHLTADPQVDVGSSWVSLTGHALVVDDLAPKQELWTASWKRGSPTARTTPTSS